MQEQVTDKLLRVAQDCDDITQAVHDVLVGGENEDIPLTNGTTTPSLNKRIKQYGSQVTSVVGKKGDVTVGDIEEKLELGTVAKYNVSDLMQDKNLITENGGSQRDVNISNKKEFELVNSKIKAAENGIIPFSSESKLLAYVPNTEPVVAKAYDTRREWIWETRAPAKEAAWYDTGLSDLDLAKEFVVESAVTSMGTVADVSLQSLPSVGAWYVKDATDWPDGFNRVKNFILINRKVGAHVVQNLIDRFNVGQEWVQINGGGWVAKPTIKEVTDVMNLANDINLKSLNNKGIIDQNSGFSSITDIKTVGAYYVRRVPEIAGFPDDFIDKLGGLLSVIQYQNYFIYKLTGRTNPSVSWEQIGTTGWQRTDVKSIVESLVPEMTVTSLGRKDGTPVTQNIELGAMYVNNADELPSDFLSRQKSVLFKNEKYWKHTQKFLQDRYRPENIWMQINNLGWSKLLVKPNKNYFQAYTRLSDTYLSNSSVKTMSHKDTVSRYIGTNTSTAILTSGKFGSSDRLDSLYGIYDELVSEYPQFVSKASIGKDSTGLDMFEYTFKPEPIGKNVSSPPSYNKFPKTLILGCHHGGEVEGILAVSMFLIKMCEEYRDDPVYSKAKSYMEIRVVPTGCPYGTKHNRRRNGNNVDLNRNWPAGWDRASESARGPSPLSELENQHILKWIQDNEDAECLINMHDHGDLSLAWGATEGFNWTHNVLFNTLKDLSVFYFENFEKPVESTDLALSWMGITVDGGLDKYCAQVLNFPTILIENPYVNHKLLPRGPAAIRMVSESMFKSSISQLIERHKYKLMLE